MPGTADATILHIAQMEKRIVVTNDKDFGELAVHSGLPAACGVVLLRLAGSNPNADNRRALEALCSRTDWPGSFVVISDDRIRIRPLPRRRPVEGTRSTEESMNTTRIQKILQESGTLTFAGVYDALSAKIAQQVGFPMAFISGYSVAATLLGEPDLGLLTQTEMIERTRRICMSVDIPVIVDADTGYGNPLNVHRTVTELIAAGAAGCFLEDQSWPKKCGHMRGKRVIDGEAYVQKIRAAVDARGGRDFFIVARSDALAVRGMERARYGG